MNKKVISVLVLLLFALLVFTFALSLNDSDCTFEQMNEGKCFGADEIYLGS